MGSLSGTNVPIILMLLLISSLAPVDGRDLRIDPITGKVRVIYIGDAIGISNPFPILDLDPLLYCIPVYACTIHQTAEQIKKSVRAYMPRTYSRFLNNDVVILSDANKGAFRTEHFKWMKDGVLDEGMGLVMIGGAESFASLSWPSWKPTDVADVLPCEMIPSTSRFSGGMVKIMDWEDEFIRSLPFDRLGAYGSFAGHNTIQPRMRAKLLAVLLHGTAGQSPFLLWWDIGEGRTMAQSADWTPAGGTTFMRWRYYGDYAINMMLFLAGQKLPEDLEMVYLVRRRMRDANEAVNTLYNMIDFIEKLGGSSHTLLKTMATIQDKKKGAMDLYIECRVEDSADAFSEVLELCEDALDQVIQVRDAAAFWIFFTEWCVVTGTSLFAGSFLWIVMIRKRLYREITTTRLIER